MRELKGVAVVFLLFFGLFGGHISAKSLNVQLQEGIHAEEVEKDLDKAINIYERLIGDAVYKKKIAAEATFRLGMCHLKKGHTRKAIEVFEEVLTKFASQGLIAAKAKEQLEKARKAIKLVLNPAVWADGELMRLRVNSMAGRELGAVIYSAGRDVRGGKDIWRIISHTSIVMSNSQQYTEVEAEFASFAPLSGRTKNLLGDFFAKYGPKKIELQAEGVDGNKVSLDVPISTVVYDQEQLVYLVRRMPLRKGYKSSFAFFPVAGGRIVDCRIEITGKEEVVVPAGKFECYKAELSMYSEGIKTLQHVLWLSADEHKYLVKYTAGGAMILELVKVTVIEKGMPLTFEDNERGLSVSVPMGWRFYDYTLGPRYFVEFLAAEVKAKAVLCSKAESEPGSAWEIAKKDVEVLKVTFKDYTVRDDSWRDVKIAGLRASQYIADYQEVGTGLGKYPEPKDMVEYRSYLAGEEVIYWFVFRTEKEKFESQRSEFDAIVSSFELGREVIGSKKLDTRSLLEKRCGEESSPGEGK